MKGISMNYTIKEVSERVGIHFSNMYKAVSKLPVDSEFIEIITNENGRKVKYITEKGLAYFLDTHNKKCRSHFSTNNNTNFQSSTNNDKYIDFLISQIKEKDNQIKDLMELNRNNQVLIQELHSINGQLLEKEKMLLGSGDPKAKNKRRFFSFLR